jgi:uncharacterized protein (UPF0303 family)
MSDGDLDFEAMLAEVRAEASERAFARFDHDVARRIGGAVARFAEEGRLPIVVSVTRGAQKVYQACFSGTTAEHEDWVRRKMNTTVRHEVPSLEFVLRQRVSGRVPDWLDPQEFAVAGGAVPIEVDGIIAGVVGVSGIVGSIRADHDLAMRALRSVAKEL